MHFILKYDRKNDNLYNQMTNKPQHNRALEQFKRLLIKQSFLDLIKQYRKEVGVPHNGFNSNEDWNSWIEANLSKFIGIQNFRVKTSNQFGLPIIYSYWVEAYLILGDNYLNYKTKQIGAYYRGFDEKPGHSCALEYDPDYQCVNIKIFSGATERDIISYLKDNFKEIQTFLKAYSNKVKPIRKLRKKDRDQIIYEYYKKGWLTNYGSIVERYYTEIPPDVNNVDMDLRRKIIQQQIKLRK